MNQTANATSKRENVWLNIGLNVLLPSLLMTKGEGWLERLGVFSSLGGALPWVESNKPAVVLVIALAFPVCYGIYDFVTRKKYNFFSVLGFVSILISGGVGLMQLDKDWIAIKEAAIPLLFAIAVFVSLKTPFPLVRTFLYSPELFDVPKVEAALKEKQNESQFEKLMFRCTVFLAGSFLLSAVLNYVLAKYFIRSESDTPEFVQEMGKMTFWSWPVIMVPSMAVMMYTLMQLVDGIEKYTGYQMEDVLLVGAKPEQVADANGDDTKQAADEARSPTAGEDKPTEA